MDTKRKTLGGLTLNHLNSRASLAPARLAGKLGKLSLGSKPSAAATKGVENPGNASSRLVVPTGTGPRRSSSYGKSTGVKSDPRPVNDKGFQGNCVRYLIAYLSTHGFDQPISPKMLASPMSKDFTAIVHFLMRQVDPHCNPKLFGKIEDDVPALYKRLRYPFQISKSSLFAVGSPHTWPSLLASLVWITELLSYAEKAEHTKTDMEDEKQGAEAEFFEYVSKAYRCFLAGDDDQCDQVVNAKAAEFDERAAEIRNHNRLLQDENEKLKAKLEEMKNSPSPLQAAMAKRDELATDQEKFKKLIDNLQVHRRSLQAKLAERQAELKNKTEQLAQQDQECKQLKERVSAQTFNCEDVARMNSEKVKQEEILQSAESSRETLQGKVREQEVSMEQCFDSLEIVLQDYNTVADRLQLIPTTAKRAGGMQFEAKLNRSGNSTIEIINIDLKGGVKTALNRIRDACFSRQRELNEEVLVLQERLDSLNHSLTERTEENATLNTQVHKAEKQLTHSKEEHEMEIRTIQAQAEYIKDEVSQLKSATSHSIADSSDRIYRLQSQYEEAAQECEMERSLFNQDVAAALHAVFEHKEYMTKTIEGVHSCVADSMSKALTMVL